LNWFSFIVADTVVLFQIKLGCWKVNHTADITLQS